MGLIRMGRILEWGRLLEYIGALINKNTFKGDAYPKGVAYWKEGANSIITVIPIIQDFKIKTSFFSPD